MKVVLADDSLKIRQIVRSMLISLGHEVLAEGVDGTQAIALCSRYRPDFAILDVSMGAVGGDIAAMRIREAGTATHILLFTSRASIKQEWEAKGFPVLIKPVMPGNLGRKIEEVLNGPG